MEAGRELDALIAEKVMGWEMKPAPSGPTQDYYQCWHENNKPVCYLHIWKPSTDIAAAWEVIEKLTRAKGQIIGGFSLSKWSMWHAKFFYEKTGGGQLEYEESAFDAPHAICLAALKAIKL